MEKSLIQQYQEWFLIFLRNINLPSEYSLVYYMLFTINQISYYCHTFVEMQYGLSRVTIPFHTPREKGFVYPSNGRFNNTSIIVQGHVTKNDQIENIHIQRGIIIYVIYYKFLIYLGVVVDVIAG